MCDQVTIGFGFTSDWLSIGLEQVFLNQSQSVVMAKSKQFRITFDTHSIDILLLAI